MDKIKVVEKYSRVPLTLLILFPILWRKGTEFREIMSKTICDV